jgi:hypothetical protein
MRPGIALALLMLLVGCGTLEVPRTGNIATPTDVLARWQSFPADQVPRPIVLPGYSPQQCSEVKPSFQPATQSPGEAVASWTDGTVRTLTAISEADAIKAMRSVSPNCPLITVLPVTAGRFGTTRLHTDRGLATMSAWLFTGGVFEVVPGRQMPVGQLAFPALPRSAFWGTDLEPAGPISEAVVSLSGETLNYYFLGGPPAGSCAENYTAVVAESAHAVVIAIQSNPGRPLAGPFACERWSDMRSVTVQLSTPLGGRVVIDAAGGVVEACSEAVRGCF